MFYSGSPPLEDSYTGLKLWISRGTVFISGSVCFFCFAVVVDAWLGLCNRGKVHSNTFWGRRRGAAGRAVRVKEKGKWNSEEGKVDTDGGCLGHSFRTENRTTCSDLLVSSTEPHTHQRKRTKGIHLWFIKPRGFNSHVSSSCAPGPSAMEDSHEGSQRSCLTVWYPKS